MAAVLLFESPVKVFESVFLKIANKTNSVLTDKEVKLFIIQVYQILRSVKEETHEDLFI